MKFGMKKNEEAVSPVIGVILMVVITVIIAAILAVFAFGIGGPAKAPEAQLRYIADPTNLTITNAGGDSLILKDEKITISNAATGSALQVSTSMDTWSGSTYLAPGKSIKGGYAVAPIAGDIIIVQILDVPTGQLVSNARVTVQ